MDEWSTSVGSPTSNAHINFMERNDGLAGSLRKDSRWLTKGLQLESYSGPVWRVLFMLQTACCALTTLRRRFPRPGLLVSVLLAAMAVAYEDEGHLMSCFGGGEALFIPALVAYAHPAVWECLSEYVNKNNINNNNNCQYGHCLLHAHMAAAAALVASCWISKPLAAMASLLWLILQAGASIEKACQKRYSGDDFPGGDGVKRTDSAPALVSMQIDSAWGSTWSIPSSCY
ncbi:unnamed protein product [Polarella glacialis]|uniref:Uncharacterized protein n=1 Tax=Polarella glacialis TaxID=89957 RepID=A0A813G2Q6_POLGL|nr:unnamed protein product [Polarella glacialis]